LTVIAADGLYKRDVFRKSYILAILLVVRILTSGAFAGFPDPFAVATVGGEQTHTTSVIKKTLNPYWNEMFDLYVALHLLLRM
jgi:E3 ubiquitin-protein ligase NEDD4